jgi:hypothetical protein
MIWKIAALALHMYYNSTMSKTRCKSATVVPKIPSPPMPFSESSADFWLLEKGYRIAISDFKYYLSSGSAYIDAKTILEYIR